MVETQKEHDAIERLAQDIERQLLQLYGSPVLTGEYLKAALGFSSLDALRQSINRDTMPVTLFKMENRRGKYALIKDIALYLAKVRYQQNKPEGET